MIPTSFSLPGIFHRAACLCLVPIILGGCSTIQEITDSIQKPKLSVDNVRVTDFNFTQMELTYDIKVENPNAVAVKMTGYDYNLDINEHPFINGDRSKTMTIEASGESIFEVPMMLNFPDLYRTVSELANEDESSYQFLSHLRFNLPIIGATAIPVKKSGNIPLLKLPKLSMQTIEVDNLSLSSADLTLKLALNNPNGFGMDIGQLNYDLIVNGNQWADGTALKGVKVKENGLTELEIPISLNITQIGTSAYQILTGSENLDYRFQGNFRFNLGHELLGSTNFDFNRSGEISVSR
jgi:LEA14-like dessication related protein